MWIIWSFRAKRALEEYCFIEHKVDLKMKGFYTFLFTVFYINYCINDLQEVQRRQSVLNS